MTIDNDTESSVRAYEKKKKNGGDDSDGEIKSHVCSYKF